VTDRLAAAPDTAFSLLDDPLMRLVRALHLAPRQGFHAPVRAVVLAVIAWAPIAVWAALTGRLGEMAWSDGAVRHIELHVRCLLALPLLVLSEPIADRVIGAIVTHFPVSGLISAADQSAFAGVVASARRLRDSKIVWGVLAAIVVLSTLLGARRPFDPDLATMTVGDFGGSWSAFVVRPLFLLMMLAWLWRLVLIWILFLRIARLDLQLVPSHPDRVGGLGFVQFQPAAFSLVVFTLSGVVCAAVAEQIVEQHARLAQFQGPLVALVVLLIVLFLCPLSAFGSALRRVRRLGQFQYGALAGRHVRGLHARWVEGRAVEDDAILAAPEIGPAADVATLYDLATRMRPLPLGLQPILAVLVPAMAPLLPVATLEIPLQEILSKVLGMLT
jgi:hypothetical protein